MAEFGEPLSERELDVLQLVMQGAANKNIAQDLVISPNTVKVHLRNIYTKLGVATRTEASMVALERGLFSLQGDGEVLLVADDEPDDGEEVEEVVETAEIVAEPAAIAPPAADTVMDDPSPAMPTATAEPAPTAAPPLPESRQRFPRWAMLALGLLGLALAVPLLWWGMGLRDITEPVVAEPTAVPANQLIEEHWYRAQPLPAPRAHSAVASVGLDVYLIGGADGERVQGDVFIYETSRRVWRTAVPKPTAVQNGSAAQLLGIYVIGGLLADGTPTDVVEMFSPAENLWRQIARLPQPVAGGVALSDGQAIYLLGGWNGSRYVADAYRYDPASNAWSALPPLPQPRGFATGGMVAGQLYLFGGENEEGVLADCLVYQTEERQWNECPAMSVARRGAGTAVVLGKLYVLGGTASTTYGEVYDPQKQEWQIINIPPELAVGDGGQSVGWQALGVVTVEAQIYLVGGQVGDGAVSAVNLIYAPPVYQTFLPAALGGQDP